MKTTLVAAALLSFLTCRADVSLPNLIGDHMLLQRDAPVRIFGKAAPGETVNVSFRGQTASAVATPLGRWEVWLQPMKPAAAGEMTIQGA
jgi:sialate O-acetylesterase